MHIRPATLEDLEALVTGNVETARETERMELDPVTVRRGVRAVLEARAPGFYRVVEDAGDVVAQLLVTYEWSDWRDRVVWWIQSVYVVREQRRRGLYRRLYESILEDARRAGAGGVRLYVDDSNHRAHSVYEALGMKGHYRVYEAMFDGVGLSD
jgi:GNAT superfamily N-acetyltransferase